MQSLVELFNIMVSLCEHGRDTMPVSYINLFATSKWQAQNLIYFLQERKLIQFAILETKEYKECIKEKEKDKRVKNPVKHCMQKHRPKQIVRINCKRISELEKEWKRMEGRRPTFPDYALLFSG